MDTDNRPAGQRAAGVGFFLGAAALVLVFVQFWAGPFAPQDSAGVSLGELAAVIKQAAIDKATGAPKPAPEPVPWDIDRVLRLVAALVAAGAVICGVYSLVQRGPHRLAVSAIALGAAAATFQFFIMAFFAIVGLALIYMILSQFDGILDF